MYLINYTFNIGKQINQRQKNEGHIPKVAKIYHDIQINSKTNQYVYQYMHIMFAKLEHMYFHSN